MLLQGNYVKDSTMEECIQNIERVLAKHKEYQELHPHGHPDGCLRRRRQIRKPAAGDHWIQLEACPATMRSCPYRSPYDSGRHWHDKLRLYFDKIKPGILRGAEQSGKSRGGHLPWWYGRCDRSRRRQPDHPYPVIPSGNPGSWWSDRASLSRPYVT